MAALDPVAFLRATRPFGDLPPPLFARAARDLDIGFFPAGTRLVERGGAPLPHLYIIRKGIVRLERDGQTLQLLEEGEVFGYTSLISGKATLDAVVEEDLLAYRIPGEQFHELLADARFASHFAAGLAERLKHSLERESVASFPADLGLRPWRRCSGARRCGSPRARPSVTPRGSCASTASPRSWWTRCPPASSRTVTFGTRCWRRSSGPTLRSRASTRRRCARSPLTMAVYEAWQFLLEAGVHHLPVARGEELLGVLTASDLLKTAGQGPPAVLRSVERLASRDALPGYGARVSEMASSLLAAASMRPSSPGSWRGSTTRSCAASCAGPRPSSDRRRRPTPGSPSGPRGEWSRRSSPTRTTRSCTAVGPSTRVLRGAGRARQRRPGGGGLPPLPGGYMARHHHGPLEEWQARFAGWLDNPKPQALLQAAIFFDFRKVSGALDLAPLEAVLARAAKARVFLAALAKAALEFRPPALPPHAAAGRGGGPQAARHLAHRLPRAPLRARGRLDRPQHARAPRRRGGAPA